MSYFVFYLSYLNVSCSGSITSVREERANCLLSFTYNYVVSIFLLVLGMGCVIHCGTPWAFHIIYQLKILLNYRLLVIILIDLQ